MCKNYLDDWFGGTAANQQLAQSQTQAQQLQQQLASDNAAREGRIRSGKASIDDAFGRYNDGYYDQYRQDYLNTQNPAIDYQYERANDKLTAALAGRGVERSTIAGNAFGDTAADYAGARAKAANDAFGASNALRERVENAKSQLYGINTGRPIHRKSRRKQRQLPPR
jgi:hypothetical protein